MASGLMKQPYPVLGVKGATQSWGNTLTFNARGNGLIISAGKLLIMFWSSGGGLNYNVVYGEMPEGMTITRDNNFNITVYTPALSTITAFWLAY